MGGVVQSDRYQGGIGLSLCSSVRSYILIDEEATHMKTTDARLLYCYQLKKIVRLKEGDPAVLYFQKDNSVLNDLFAGNLPLKTETHY